MTHPRNYTKEQMRIRQQNYDSTNECIDDKGVFERLDCYSEFLKDGDWEYWQQFTDLDPSSVEYMEKRLDALRILNRGIWISSRFVNYFSNEYWELEYLMERNFWAMMLMQNIIQNKRLRSKIDPKKEQIF